MPAPLRIEEPTLAADHIQGNIVPGFNLRFQWLVGLRITDVPGARAWLSDVRTRVATLADVATLRHRRRTAHEKREARPEPDRTLVNLALSAGGLRKLMGGAAVGAVLDPWFKAGMWSAAGSLGDTPASLSDWTTGASAEMTPDILVILAHDTPHALDEDTKQLVGSAQAHQLKRIFAERGNRLADNREHFGFRDGISIPAVRGLLPAGSGAGSPSAADYLYPRRIPRHNPLSARFARPGQALLWPGSAVFGYHAQNPSSVSEPGPVADGGAAWMRNGSFLVFRRLRQDVEAFNAFVAEQAEALQADPGFQDVDTERFKALLVGRWPDGTPLVRSPDQPDYTNLSANHFQYANELGAVRDLRDGRGVAEAPADLDGRLCPQFAHIRKVNPRDAPSDLGGEARALSLQIFRRGIPFGEPFQDAPDQERGMHFLAYTTAIEERYGRLNGAWMNAPDAPEAGTPGHDLLAGQADDGRARFGRLRRNGAEREIRTNRRWVIPTGGGFFFSPSLALIGQLGRGSDEYARPDGSDEHAHP